MALYDRASILYRLAPVNKERLDDNNIMDVLKLIIRGNNAVVIDSVWTSKLIYGSSEEKKVEYRQRIERKIVDADAESPIAFLPLFDDEHWSLLVVILNPVKYFYFHLDSATPTHLEYCQNIIASIDILKYASQLALPKRVPQQREEFECGHFVLMNASMVLSFRMDSNKPKEIYYNKEKLCRHLSKEMLSASDRNMRSFVKDIARLL